MDSDMMLVIGIVLGLLTIPALLSAYTEGRVPRSAAIVLMIGGGLIAIAVWQSPSGYTFDEIVQAFERVFARLVR